MCRRCRFALLHIILSGTRDIAALRELLAEHASSAGVGLGYLRPVAVGAERSVGQDALRLVHVGCGRDGPQSRPQCVSVSSSSSFFFLLCQSDAVANRLYGEQLSARVDLDLFLQPLLGTPLVYDCDRGFACRVHIILRVLHRVSVCTLVHASNMLDMCFPKRCLHTVFFICVLKHVLYVANPARLFSD